MNDKERRVKEQRYIEASRKMLLGLEGKLGVILKQLGEPIISQGGTWFDSTPMIDVWELPDEETGMPTFEEDEAIIEVGMIFDGMSSGIHVEIKYIEDEKALSLRYKGQLVFSEMNDELQCYVPSPEWEKHVDDLFNIAKKREEKKHSEYVEESKLQSKREKLSFLEQLRLRWGI